MPIPHEVRLRSVWPIRRLFPSSTLFGLSQCTELGSRLKTRDCGGWRNIRKGHIGDLAVAVKSHVCTYSRRVRAVVQSQPFNEEVTTIVVERLMKDTCTNQHDDASRAGWNEISSCLPPKMSPPHRRDAFVPISLRHSFPHKRLQFNLA